MTRQAASLLAAATAALGAACSTPAPTAQPAPQPTPAATPAAPAGNAGRLVFASMTGKRTEQGAAVEGFAYSEKPGDATLTKVNVAEGAANVSGVIWPQKGSTWAGVALSVDAAAAVKTIDVSSYKALTLQLAGNAPSLRIRLMGTDKATRDNGCYPVVVQPVTPELREYSIELSRFAPEGYCGANARSLAATSTAVATVEVADPKVGGGKRDVDFRVGHIAFSR